MAIKDPFAWVMGPQRLVTFVISALEMFLLTYLAYTLSALYAIVRLSHWWINQKRLKLGL